MYIDKERLKEDLNKLTPEELEKKLMEVTGAMILLTLSEPDSAEDCYKLAEIFATLGALMESDK